VLNDVERGAFGIEPAREDPLELTLRVAHVELDKGAGQLLHLPGRRRLAGAEPDDHIVRCTDRLSGLQRQVARDAVALVEQADHGDALRHRRRSRRERGHGLRHVDGLRLRFGLGILLLRHRPGPVAPAGGDGEEQQRGGGAPDAHASSGVQAS
jgi:hypothetical protein